MSFLLWFAFLTFLSPHFYVFFISEQLCVKKKKRKKEDILLLQEEEEERVDLFHVMERLAP